MKTTMHISRFVLIGLVLGLTLLATGCSSTGRQWSQSNDAVNLRQITTAQEEQLLKPTDSAALVCTSCKSVIYLNLARPQSALHNPLGENHPCPACKAVIKRLRVGRTHQFRISHACEKCGADSVFCGAGRYGDSATK